ncbi:uncharacterized protein LOC133906711 [Phragmites australis]|uniref:uncharacterized protein LOC133906711 n=1 Tax=Phragmites australis TaxID=29695 RepID=UPI002D79CE4B|nr:uncharacterized protein LOC133906711 [Phragmites australis]
MLPLLNMQGPAQSSKQLMRTVSISILVMSLLLLYVSFLHVPPAALFKDTTFWFLMSNSIIIVIAADSGMLFFGSSSSSCSVDADVDDGLSFVVSGGEPAGVKNGHASTGVSVSEEVDIIKNQALLLMEQGDLMEVIAENERALVVRDDQGERVASEPESREIMAISPPSAPAADVGAGEAVAMGGATVRARQRLTASRSLAREERTRRRHSHRPSHSHALVAPVQDKSVVVREERQLRRTATEGRPSAAEETEKESEYSRLSDEELNRRVEEFISSFNREIRLQLEKEQASLMHASVVHA